MLTPEQIKEAAEMAGLIKRRDAYMDVDYYVIDGSDERTWITLDHPFFLDGIAARLVEKVEDVRDYYAVILYGNIDSLLDGDLSVATTEQRIIAAMEVLRE